MKLKFIPIIIMLLATGACGDFLEESPKEIASENFYNTAAEMESAVMAAYVPLQANQAVFGRHYHTIQMSQLDYGYGRGSYASVTDFAGLDATNVNRVGDMWTNFYLSIRNSNLVLANKQRALENGVNENAVQKLVAEAKYMRALCYFYLVRHWAGVPLRTEDNMDQPDLARASEQEIYTQIENDLKEAEVNLPEGQTQVGRATKWAAKTMYADVLVNLKRWEEARAKAKEVMDANQFSLLPVAKPDDYYKIFGPDVINSKEEIFYIKFTGTKPSNFVFMLHHPKSPYYGGDGAYGLYTDSVKNKEIASWDPKDLRKKYNLYNMDIGLGSKTTMLYKKFIEPDKTLGLSTDYPIYRYADLLLFYAEASCQAEGKGTAEGLEVINKLHRRAYGLTADVKSSLDFNLSDYTEKERFLELLDKERMYELFCEGKRFLELKRTGKLAAAILKNHNKTVVEKHLLWPIPNAEYFYNKAIDEAKDQNPGY